MKQIQSELQILKGENRETGRVLFDINELTRQEWIKGMLEIKKRLNKFSEVIEYLDDQAKESRKVVFDKNNKIGKFFNEIQEYKQQIDTLSKVYLKLKI